MGGEGIYGDSAWQMLEPRVKRNLIYVLEGVVPGTSLVLSEEQEELEVIIAAVGRVCTLGGLNWEVIRDENGPNQACVEASRYKIFMEFIMGRDYSGLGLDPVYRRLSVSVPEERRLLLAETIRQGRFYGFPACCIESFAEGVGAGEMGEDRKAHALFWEEFRRNISGVESLARYTLWSAFLDHVPCSIDCEKSAGLAKMMFRAVVGVEPDLSKELYLEAISTLGK